MSNGVVTLYRHIDPQIAADLTQKKIDKIAKHLKDVACILICNGEYTNLAEMLETLQEMADCFKIEDDISNI